MYLPRGPPPCQKRLRQVVKSHCLNCCLVLYRAQAGTIFLCSRGSISENNRIKGLPALGFHRSPQQRALVFLAPNGLACTQYLTALPPSPEISTPANRFFPP